MAHQSIYQSKFEGLFGRKGMLIQHQLNRWRQAQQPHQPLGPPIAGQHPKRDLRQANPNRFIRNRQTIMASEGQLVPQAEGCAIQSGYNGFALLF